MEAETIVKALTERGWQASIVSVSELSDVVEVGPTGMMKCVDGRLSDQSGMDGPKALGGIYAIASMREVTDLDGLAEIVQEVMDAGYVPSVHGDEHASPPPMGCGYFKLWVTGQLGITPPNFTAEQGQQAVIDAGGVYESLKGGHEEKEVLINLVPDTTFEPQVEQRFVVDAWVASRFDLDPGRYLGFAAQTVELLGGPRVARIVVP